MKPIAVFYHCLFVLSDGPGKSPVFLPRAFQIVAEQMGVMSQSGLLENTSHFCVGINGGPESAGYADRSLPAKAQRVYHGLNSRAENLTIVEIEKWAPANPGWNVLYFHAKGCTHPPGQSYGENVSAPWRRTMTHHLVNEWRRCVGDLEAADSVGCHFMRNMADGTQNIWAGNFWWATSDFLARVPSIFLRERIKVSGIAGLESRYEAEVWLGNSKPLPKVVEYLPAGGQGVP